MHKINKNKISKTSCTQLVVVVGKHNVFVNNIYDNVTQFMPTKTIYKSFYKTTTTKERIYKVRGEYVNILLTKK